MAGENDFVVIAEVWLVKAAFAALVFFIVDDADKFTL